MKARAVLIASLVLASPTSLYAEACTYDEARMAFLDGNMKRASVLMQMAVNDGDHRAVQFLKKYSADLGEEKQNAATLFVSTDSKLISAP